MNYPHLIEAYPHLVQLSKLYEIDLSQADSNEKYGNQFGAQPNDINLDICGSIHDYLQAKQSGCDQKIITFVIEDLENWGYDYDEIAEALANSKLELES